PLSIVALGRWVSTVVPVLCNETAALAVTGSTMLRLTHRGNGEGSGWFGWADVGRGRGLSGPGRGGVPGDGRGLGDAAAGTGAAGANDQRAQCAGAPVRVVHQRVPVAVAAVRCGGVHLRTALWANADRGIHHAAV